MRKSLIMGTKEDVIKRRATQSVRTSNDNGTSVPVGNKRIMTDDELKEFIAHGLQESKKRIVTFNHPILMNSQ